MKRRSALGACLVAVTLAAFGCAHPPSAERGWVALIDGASGLDNWTAVGTAEWKAGDGAIHASTGSGYLVSKSAYRDFRIRAEFWAAEDTNSGIFLRLADPKEITPANSYEVNIYDRRPDPAYGTGAIVNFAKVVPMPLAAGRWNTYDITAKGPHIVVMLNGTKTVDIRDESFTSGPIALQSAGGVIRWRKVMVRPLQ